MLPVCAARHKVAPRLIADGDDPSARPESAPESPLAYALPRHVRIYAERLKRGELALKVDRGGEVVLLSLGTSEARSETGVAAG